MIARASRGGSALGSLLLAALLGTAFQTLAAPMMEQRSAPSESERPPESQAPLQRLELPASRAISLPPPRADEIQQKSVPEIGAPVPVAFGRDVAAFDLSERATFEGTAQAVRMTITSYGARQLRVGIRLPQSGSYRITTWRPDHLDLRASVTHASESVDTAPVWSGLVEGDTAEVLVERLSNEASDNWSFAVVRLSHFPTSESNSNAIQPKNFGDSAYCQVDAACIVDLAPISVKDAVLIASRSVALMVTTDTNGASYRCTGTLLNSDYYPAPILLTANHCIDNASSLLTVWFYSRSTCGVGGPGNYVQTTGGAKLLYASAPYDAALLQLNSLPPPNVPYTGWDPGRITSTTTIGVFHHPRGDVKKASFGEVVSTQNTPITIGPYTYAPGTFYIVDWEVGVVEPGSSGSALYSAGTDYLYVRGTLTGGSATCSNSKSRTYYSQLANFYPEIKKYLKAPANPQAVEYFHSGFGHYFVTVLPDEIAKLDNGTFAGWSRTGYTFNVYALGTIGTQSVCRFFTTAFAPRSSHFYTPSASECATVKTNKNWTYEALVFGFVAPSATGTCDTGTAPLYRLYNNGKSGAPNHRYTTSLGVRSTMITQGWIPEGNGTLGVIGCVPV